MSINRNLRNLIIDADESNKFSSLLNQSGDIKRGVLMSGVVTKIDSDFVWITVGLKSDGRIQKQEFFVTGEDSDLPKLGSSITVFLESIEDSKGDVVLSYSKAIRQSSWSKLEEFFNKRESISGIIIRKVHGGYIVNIQGVSAFLPKSCFSAEIIDAKTVIGKEYMFKIIKMDLSKSNIVVSLKDVAATDSEIFSNFAEGQTVEGVVKNITETAAFVEIAAGLVARLHISEISWNKVENISDIIKLGQTIETKIVSISQGNRINISLKELQENPWSVKIKALNLELGKSITASVKKIDGKIAILKISDEIEAKLRMQDVAWVKRGQNFNNLKIGSSIKVRVIELDPKKRKIVCSLKDMMENPVEEFKKENKVGDMINGTIIQLSELGYVVQISEDLDGIIPNSANYVSGSLKVGDTLKLYIHNISTSNNHVILGNKIPS